MELALELKKALNDDFKWNSWGDLVQCVQFSMNIAVEMSIKFEMKFQNVRKDTPTSSRLVEVRGKKASPSTLNPKFNLSISSELHLLL